MNKKLLITLIGTVVRLRPKPKREGEYITDSRNQWHVLSETEDKKGLILKNVLTKHEFVLQDDSINQYRSQDLLVLRGQPVLMGEHSVDIEPFIDAPEPIDAEEPTE